MRHSLAAILAAASSATGLLVAEPLVPLSPAGEAARAGLLAHPQLLPDARGFSATGAQRREVTALIDALVACDPASSAPDGRPDLTGDWELIYTDAPDIIGLQAGGPLPLSTLGRVGQRIDAAAGTIANVIEYSPPAWAPAALGEPTDVVQQRVLLEYEADGPRCTARLSGVALRAKRLRGAESSLPPLQLRGPVALPFGSFDVKYNDGALRVVRTAQGFVSINRRCAPDEGWGADE